jgi:hypothetical protein
MITRDDILNGILAEFQAPKSFKEAFARLSNEQIIKMYKERIGVTIERVSGNLFQVVSVYKHY